MGKTRAPGARFSPRPALGGGLPGRAGTEVDQRPRLALRAARIVAAPAGAADALGEHRAGSALISRLARRQTIRPPMFRHTRTSSMSHDTGGGLTGPPAMAAPASSRPAREVELTMDLRMRVSPDRDDAGHRGPAFPLPANTTRASSDVIHDAARGMPSGHMLRRYSPPTSYRAWLIWPRLCVFTASTRATNTLRRSRAAFCR